MYYVLKGHLSGIRYFDELCQTFLAKTKMGFKNVWQVLFNSSYFSQ